MPGMGGASTREVVFVFAAACLACARSAPGDAPAPYRPRVDVAPLPADRVAVPAGEFTMGCTDAADRECGNDERPARRVPVGAFAIDRTEVTVEAWQRCVDAGACRQAITVGACNAGSPERGRFPVNCVTWYQARDYCRWAGARLPTEAEWEKAARGTDGRRYPWGDDAPGSGGAFRANWGEGLARILWMRDGFEYDAPVGLFPSGASPWGALDMAGNLAEWVADWYGPYVAGAVPDPAGPASGTARVVRGGSFQDYARRIRATARDRHEPERWFEHVGFRCAM